MDTRKRTAVIGNGPLSLSIAGQCHNQGCEVLFIDTSLVQPPPAGITLQFRGAAAYTAGPIPVSNDVAGAGDADMVMITLPASCYDAMFDELIPELRENQIVVFFPASYGAVKLRMRLREERPGLDITICEAVSFPYVCDMGEGAVIHVHDVKSRLRLAATPYPRTEEMIGLLSGIFRGLVPAKNVLETSLDNINGVLHPLPVLLNMEGVERRLQSFRHFIDGVTPAVGRLLELMDAERIAIGEAYGLALTPTLEQLKSYYGANGEKTIAEYVSSPDGPYPDVKAFGLDSRYIIQDVPFLLVPAAAFGKAACIPTPVMEITMRLAELVMGRAYSQTGYSLENLGLDGMPPEEIIHTITAL